MVPSVFVPLPELPLTPNGKIDRRALAALPLQGESATEDRAPSRLRRGGAGGDLERDLRPSGGGERELLRSRRPLAARHPPGLAGARGARRRAAGARGCSSGRRSPGWPRASRRRSASAERLEARIEPCRRTGPLPLSFAQERLWFLHQLEPGTRPTTCRPRCELAGPLDAGALAVALGEVVRRHEALRDHLRGDRRRALPGDRAGRPPLAAAARRPRGPARRRRRRRGGAPGTAAGGHAVRSRARTAPARSWLRLGAERAPSCCSTFTTSSPTAGRSGCCCASWGRSTRRSPGPAVAAAGAAGPVRRLRRLAAPPALGRGAGGGSWPSGAGSWTACRRLELPTDRPRPALLSGRGASCPVALPAALARRPGAALPGGAGDAVHGAATPASPCCSSAIPGRRISPSARRWPAAPAPRRKS